MVQEFVRPLYFLAKPSARAAKDAAHVDVAGAQSHALLKALEAWDADAAALRE